jgi:hypothetical protein
LRGEGLVVADPLNGFTFPLTDEADQLDAKFRALLPTAFSLMDDQIPDEVNVDPATSDRFPRMLKWLPLFKAQRRAVVIQNLPFPTCADLRQQTENGRKMGFENVTLLLGESF